MRAHPSPVVELAQLVLEARGEVVRDVPLLAGPCLGAAVEPCLGVVLVDDLVHVDLLARPGLDGGRQVGVEVATRFPADDFCRAHICSQGLG